MAAGRDRGQSPGLAAGARRLAGRAGTVRAAPAGTAGSRAPPHRRDPGLAVGAAAAAHRAGTPARAGAPTAPCADAAAATGQRRPAVPRPTAPSPTAAAGRATTARSATPRPAADPGAATPAAHPGPTAAHPGPATAASAGPRPAAAGRAATARRAAAAAGATAARHAAAPAPARLPGAARTDPTPATGRALAGRPVDPDGGRVRPAPGDAPGRSGRPDRCPRRRPQGHVRPGQGATEPARAGDDAGRRDGPAQLRRAAAGDRGQPEGWRRQDGRLSAARDDVRAEARRVRAGLGQQRDPGHPGHARAAGLPLPYRARPAARPGAFPGRAGTGRRPVAVRAGAGRGHVRRPGQRRVGNGRRDADRGRVRRHPRGGQPVLQVDLRGHR